MGPTEHLQPIEKLPRPPLERNLDIHDFQAPGVSTNAVPTMEAVLEDLREASYQYINCGDPTESAARRQRVLESEHSGLVEQTANNIIAAAHRDLFINEAALLPPQVPLIQSPPTEVSQGETQTELQTPGDTRRSKGHHGRTNRSQASPRIIAGASSRRRLLAQASHPYARHGFPHSSPIQPTPRRRNQDPPGRTSHLCQQERLLEDLLRIFTLPTILSLSHVELELLWSWESHDNSEAQRNHKTIPP